MKKYLALMLVVALSACGEEKEIPVPPGALARVNDTFITQKDFEEKTSDLPAEYKKYGKTSFGKSGLINAFVREEVIKQNIKESKISETPYYKEELRIVEEGLAQQLELAKEAIALRAWEKDLQEKGIIAVTDEEIKAYQKKYPVEITIKQIILDNANTAGIVQRGLRGASQSRFIELTRQYSVSPEAKNRNGDELSFIPGEFFPEIENAAANLSSGAIQGFFKTSRGFYIIMKISERRLPAKEAQPRIRKILENKKRDEYLDKLSEKYRVEVYENHE